MTDHEAPCEGDQTGDSSGHPTRRERPAAQSRRGLLQTLSIGGSLVLAGCGQQDPSTPPGNPEVSGQTLRLPIRENDPAKTTFLRKAPQFTLAQVVKEKPSHQLRQFVWESGVWIDGLWVGADVSYNWIEKPIEISPTEVKITITDEARWSDGHAITGTDIAVTPLERTILRGRPPAYAAAAGSEPADVWTAIDGFDIADETVTFRSSAGYFADFWDWTIRTQFGALNTQFLPTHVEPYEAYADAVISTTRRAQQGEIRPWKRPRPGKEGDPHARSLKQKYLGKRKYVEKFSEAENVLATGAWDLVGMSGTEFIFEPNSHHRNADTINFETLIYEYTPSDSRLHTAFTSDRLDYGSAVTPREVVESFPDRIEQLRIPGGWNTGNELALDFDHPALGQRAVREALMYVLDHSKIATNIHPSTAELITTPGGDCWDATDYVSREWIDENLTTYTTDREKATRLLREAGFTRDGEQWMGSDGEPIALTLATPNDTPRWEPSVASQLGEFGIQTSVKTMSETSFEDRTDNGEFATWSSDVHSATNDAAATLLIWLEAARREANRKFGIYPDEQFGTITFSHAGWPLPRTEEEYDVFTVKAPPIGQPNGPLEEYHPAALSLAFWTNPPREEFRRRVKTGMWLANWFLPTIPINKTREQHFIDDAHWLWPTDTPSWKAFTGGGRQMLAGILGSGHIRANPENPEAGNASENG